MNPPMRRTLSRLALLLVALTAFVAGPAAAQSLNVDIVGGLKTATPIAVVPFAQAGGAPLPTDVADVIRADFNRSGKFRSLDKADIVETPSQGSEIKFPTWRLLKQDFLTIGRINDAGGGMLKVEYELWDVNKQQSLLAQSFTAPAGDLRGVAHQIADQIYEKITGVRGAFWTRIAYITAVGTGNNATYSLIVADSDGFNPQVVARSRESLLSPSWSPDGSKLAVSLSYVGNPEIFVIDVASHAETRLTNNFSIDTEPTYTPDGQSILFTSDRSGKPQIYQMSASGGAATRVTFQGGFNASASVSFDGKQIAMVQGNGNVYRIAIMDRSLGGQVRFVSPGNVDDSPSFAPNASMLLYAASQGTRGVLYAVSADGLVRQRLVLSDGDVREPSWGPYRQR